MAYVATKGGETAIAQAEGLYRALNGQLDADFVRAVERAMPYLVDRVMGEGSLYAPELAALALAQSGGDLYEAVLLLRAYRSTQPRLAYAEPLDTERALTVRRISAAFKDIPGGQFLGPTLDYSHRLLKTEILDGRAAAEDELTPETDDPLAAPAVPAPLPTVAGWHRLNGLMAPLPEDAADDPASAPDVTRDPIAFPAPRAHRLQSLARADTGGVLALGYASMRGYGLIHPTVNELRLAYAELELRHPVTGALFSAGRVRYSQAEVVTPEEATKRKGAESANGAAPPAGKAAQQLGLGFAATIGWNEVKCIAGSMLDKEMSSARPHPAHDEEFVLYHTEPVEASGFCIHYKLPHYVTFASTLDAVRRTGEKPSEPAGGAPLAQTEANS
jgi:alpha-D-ribose 1-methylphosphonate 5-triphosphate synthase subunit PhnI